MPLWRGRSAWAAWHRGDRGAEGDSCDFAFGLPVAPSLRRKFPGTRGRRLPLGARTATPVVKPRLLIVSAVPAELPPASPALALLAAGIGPVEAASAVAAALAREAYGAVVSVGIAGSFGRIANGGIAIVAEDILAELGVEGGEAIQLPSDVTLVDRAYADPVLVETARRALPEAAVGRGVTVSTVTATDRRAAELRQRFDPLVESMEGFAVLRTAQRAGVRALELRAVSNLVGVRDRGAWDIPGALRALHAACARLWESLL
ncbi:futalosine hydrolase [bacterium]|nr:MAG: futalosine hydrolase [bacterium]